MALLMYVEVQIYFLCKAEFTEIENEFYALCMITALLLLICSSL
jgi:hypothetical protein